MARAKTRATVVVTTCFCVLWTVANARSLQTWSTRYVSVLRTLAMAKTGAARQHVIDSTDAQASREEMKAAIEADETSQWGETNSNGSPPLPSRCPGDCTKYGTCNEELARCDCPMGRSGPDCSQLLSNAERLQLCSRNGHTNNTCGVNVDQPMCLNACNFRGRCIGGFCHCRPGLFGADCSLSISLEPLNPESGAAALAASAAAAPHPRVEVLAGQGYIVRASGPRIYVYELPPHMNTYQNLDRLDRPLMYMLWQRWLSAGMRVADPGVADFFYVPVRARMLYDSDRVAEAVSYIRTTWPYWNATGGARHIFVHTGDWGRDDLTEDVQLLTRNATWLTHWGLTRDHDFAGWTQSHRPGRDVVLPLMLQNSIIATYRAARATLMLQGDGTALLRTWTLFFAGRVCGSRAQPSTNGTYPNCPNVLGKEDAYSAATRQRAFFFHHNRTNWKVVTKTRSYTRDMLTSKFCLAPSGGGVGKRSVLSVLMGCVPVTVTDGLLQPFEPELRWERFAIDVRERDIGLMHELLERLRSDQVAEFQSNLPCAAQHLFWSSLYGSVFGEDGRYDAFETLVQVLRMRTVYPTVGPEEYEYVDPDFAAFIRCQPPPSAAAAGAGAVAEAALPPPPGVSAAAVAAAAAADAGMVTPGEGAIRTNGSRTLGIGDSSLLTGLRDAEGVGEAHARVKPGLQEILSDSSRPQPRPLPQKPGARPPLCSHTETGAGRALPCNRCVRRRGRLLNPGGTICCNTRDLAKCPRFWD